MFELNLWLQPKQFYRSALNINRGATKLTPGKLESINDFMNKGIHLGYTNMASLDIWINATNPDPDALYAWSKVGDDYVSWNPKNAFANIRISGLDYRLPQNLRYRQTYKNAPDISFRN